MEKRLYCGAARAVITPPVEWIPNLRGLADMQFGGVLDDLRIRAVAIGNGRNTMLLVSYDLDKAPYPEESMAWIVENTGIPEENVFLFGTHAHSVPVLGPRNYEAINAKQFKPTEVRKAIELYENYVQEKMHDVVKEAVASMRPARMGSGTGMSYINVNRTQNFEWPDDEGNIRSKCLIGINPEGPVDRTVFVLKLEDMKGSPIAFLINYAVHSAVIFPNDLCDGKMGISGDIAGNVSHLTEEKFPDSVAVWSPAPCGDVNPFIMNAITYRAPLTGAPVYGKLKGNTRLMLDFIAAMHFADVEKVIDKIECTCDTADMAGTMGWSRIPMKKAEKYGNGTWEVSDEPAEEPYSIRLHLVCLGNLAFCGVSGELFTTLGWRMKSAAPIDMIIITDDYSQATNCNYIADDEGLRLHAHGTNPGVEPGLIGASLETVTREMFTEL